MRPPADAAPIDADPAGDRQRRITFQRNPDSHRAFGAVGARWRFDTESTSDFGDWFPSNVLSVSYPGSGTNEKAAKLSFWVAKRLD